MFQRLRKSWFWFICFERQHRPARKKARFRPKLEFLEDRLTPSSSISGHAFTDLTGDGLSLDDPAKSGVTIRLYRDTNHDAKLDAGDRLVATRVTGADGSYSFDNLAPGRYFVSARTPHGFVSTAPISGSYYTINLHSNTTAGGNNFDFFKKVNTHVISRISFTVSDPTRGTHTFSDLRGHTHQGDTVTVHFRVARGATATVSLVTYDAPGPRFNSNTASQQVIADLATGTFTGGTHSLTVHIPSNFYQIDFVDGAAIDHFGPAVSNIFYSAQRRLLSADNGGTQRQVTGSISGSVFSDNNRDNMIGAGATGISGVRVVLTGTNDLGASVSLSVLTDSSGFYSFTGLRQGVYSLQQEPPVNFSAESDFTGSLGGSPDGPSMISTIVLHNGQNGINYDFLDLPPVQLQTYSISGTVFGPSAFSIVTITDTTTQKVYSVNVVNRSYSLAGLPAGDSFTITAAAPGFTSNTITIPVLRADMPGQNLQLRPL
jgi:hypothetical protein